MPKSSTTPAGRSLRLKDGAVAALALLAFALFALFFYRFSLPNNPDYSRGDLWRLLPDLLFENIAPLEDGPGPPSGWVYFPQRLDLLATALVILAGCWGLGHLLLRGLRPRFNGRDFEPKAAGSLGETRPDDGGVATVLAMGCGISAWSLLTLLCGVAGLLSQTLFAVMPAVFCGTELALRQRERPRRTAKTSHVPAARESVLHRRFFSDSLLAPACILATAPFLLAMLLGAMLPSTDFDVKEYHLQGPKEYFQAGRIRFLPHNVYTSFPFLTEMLSLSAMVLRGDWYRGALAGKVVLMSFAPWTALALYAAGRRWFGAAAGWFAALIYLTTPWVYRISIIAYAEGGLSFFLFASLLAAMLAIDAIRDRTAVGRAGLLAGFLAGSAVACKYPAVISVAMPLGLAILAAGRLRPRLLAGMRLPHAESEQPPPERQAQPDRRGWTAWRPAVCFAVGGLMTFGPWMLKNTVETGNPVYPLLYSIFGGADWDDALNAKWRRAHSPPVEVLSDPAKIPPDLWERMVDVAARSDWQSVLVFGFAVVAPFLVRRRTPRLSAGEPSAPTTMSEYARLWGLVAYVGWLFLTWWGLTHRIDRFWVPMLPVVSLIAGVGAACMLDRLRSAGGRPESGWGRLAAAAPLTIAVLPNLLFNLGLVTYWLSGPNMYLLDEQAARRLAMTRSMAIINEQRLSAEDRVLLVGEAQVFDARFPHVYNTVFDQSLFQIWSAGAGTEADAGRLPMRPPADILQTLHEQGITHIFVNWQEILRYRTTYGYTDFVHPDRFRRLVEQGVLRPLPLPAQALTSVEDLSPEFAGELDRWAPNFATRAGGRRIIPMYQWFAVTP